jgi:hypothetical protein
MSWKGGRRLRERTADSNVGLLIMVECMISSSASVLIKPVTPVGERCGTEDPMVMPAEHLEARICELAGHLAAATCRYLLLVADFDAWRGWAAWEMPSCAAWLAWKCQVALGTAREQVRVARAIKALPVIRGEFAAGRFSYAKVRALTVPSHGRFSAVEVAHHQRQDIFGLAEGHCVVAGHDLQSARQRRGLLACEV